MNNSTDEALNAAHHLMQSIQLESRRPFPDPVVLANLRTAQAVLDQALEYMHAPELSPDSRLRRLLSLWPYRVR